MTTDTSDEILARVRRIETRLFKLCIHEGLESPPNSLEITTGRFYDNHPYVKIRGFDTTLSDIKRAALAGGIDPFSEELALLIEGREVAYLSFERS